MRKNNWLLLSTVLAVACAGLMPHSYVCAADSITFKNLKGVTCGTSQTIAAGDTIDDKETDVLCYLYNGCELATTYSTDMGTEITAVHTGDVSAHGTTGAGSKATWFVTTDGALYVTGTDTLAFSTDTTADADHTLKTISSSSGVKIENPDIRKTEIADPTTGDEASVVSPKYYTTQTAGNTVIKLNGTGDITWSGTYPQTAQPTANGLTPTTVPWYSKAADIMDVYMSDQLTLTGNASFLFNANCTSGKSSSDVNSYKESAYTSLENVYLYSDTKGLTRTADMFMRCPKLANVYVRSGNKLDLTADTDATGMFFGDALLENTDGTGNISAVNVITNTGALRSTAYMFAGCEKINKPKVGGWDMSKVETGEGMFLGATDANLTCDSASASEAGSIYNWGLSSLEDGLLMFSGDACVYSTTASGTPYLKAYYNTYPGAHKSTDTNVITGVVDFDHLGCTKLKTAEAMFEYTSISGITMKDSYAALQDTSLMCAACNDLNAVNMSGFSAPLDENMTCMFMESGTSGTADLSSAKLSGVKSAALMFYGAGYDTVNMYGTNPSALLYADGMFSHMPNLASLGSNGLDSWKLTNLITASYMLSDCPKLTSVNSTDWGMDVCTDASYLCADDSALTILDMSKWVGGKIDINCILYNCPKVTIADISKLTGVTNAFMAFAKMPALTKLTLPSSPSSLTDANGMLWCDTSLTDITLPAMSSLNDARGMLAGCTSLTSATVASAGVWPAYMFLGDTALTAPKVTDTSKAVYMQGMYMGDTALTSLDMSSYDFSAATDLTYLTYGDDKLVTIKVPASFTTAVTAMSAGGKNIFYVDGDTSTDTDDLLTYYYTPSMQTNMKSYSWSGDNRKFLKLNGRTINGTDTGSLNFTKGVTSAKMAVDVTGTYYVNGTPDISYSWTKGGSAISNTTDNYTASRSGADTYIATAKLAKTDNETLPTTFKLTAVDYVSAMTAKYTGDTITVGDNYSKDDVTVTVTLNDDTTTKKTLKSSDWAASSLKVTSKGDNTYTATYSLNGTDTTASYTVPGKRVIGTVEAKYKGKSIPVGSDYASSDVVLTAYYKDDTNKAEGFTVTPDSLSSTTVTKVGDNSYTATYTDPDTKTVYSPKYTVPGYSKIVSIKAVYNGPDIVVSKNYDKANVVVTAQDANGDNVTLTQSDFSVNSQKVSKVGANTYTVTYTNDDGSFTTTFPVTGYRAIGSITAKYTGPVVNVGENYDASNVIVTAYYADDTSKSEGFTVTPTKLSSLAVTKNGDNTYTATYVDTAQNDAQFTGTYTVPGYKAIKSIDATYTGDPVTVGGSYDKDKVTVTVHYADGTSATTKDFTVDSTTVPNEGDNPFNATVTDTYGNTYQGPFTVKGVTATAKATATGVTPSNVSAPAATAATAGIVKTGDTGRVILYIIAIIALAGCVAGAVFYKKKH
jgi:hypothetical protein